uniref:PAP-associated domain-containing protein n=1 Tax=Steinernema glaseri TaxID=37863 RepID=A0A1I7ZNF3_9BILA
MLSQTTRQFCRNARRLVKSTPTHRKSNNDRQRSVNALPDGRVTLHSGDMKLKIETEYEGKISALTKKLLRADKKRREGYAKLVQERSAVVAQLQKVICASSSRLIPVGSLANSLGSVEGSDIDLCFVAEKHDEFLRAFNDHPNFKIALMRSVADLLEGSSEVKLKSECQLVMRSRIPLVIVNLANGVSVDIQFPNATFQAVRNTNLIRHYVMADKRFAQLYIWARQLFTALGAKNSKQGLLSSYHIMLLVVHFLQCKHIFSEPVLPVLTQTHPHLVSRELPPSEVIKLLDQPITDQLEGWQSQNNMQVGVLAVRMIEYYSRFNVGNTVIDIGRGRAMRRRQTPYNRKLQVLDPYSRVTVCHSRGIVDAFCHAVTSAHEAFRSGTLIDSYPVFDDVPERTSRNAGHTFD